MIATLPVLFTSAPANAGLALVGFAPLLWLPVGLVALGVAVIAHEAWSARTRDDADHAPALAPGLRPV